MDNFEAVGQTITFAAAVAANGKPNSAPGAKDYLVSNRSSNWAFVGFGSTEVGAETAATISGSDGGLSDAIPVAPLSTVIFAAKGPTAFIAVSLDAGTGTVHVTPGNGS